MKTTKFSMIKLLIFDDRKIAYKLLKEKNKSQ